MHVFLNNERDILSKRAKIFIHISCHTACFYLERETMEWVRLMAETRDQRQ